MPNIDEMMNGISQIIAERKDGEVYVATFEFKYAYGQVTLEAKQANNATSH